MCMIKSENIFVRIHCQGFPAEVLDSEELRNDPEGINITVSYMWRTKIYTCITALNTFEASIVVGDDASCPCFA